MDFKKGVGVSIERSESGSGDRYEYPYILKRGVMFLNQEVAHLNKKPLDKGRGKLNFIFAIVIIIIFYSFTIFHINIMDHIIICSFPFF